MKAKFDEKRSTDRQPQILNFELKNVICSSSFGTRKNDGNQSDIKVPIPFDFLTKLRASVTRLGDLFHTLGNFSKPVAIINLPKSPTFLGNFCKGVKIFYFSSEIIFGQLLQTFGNFLLVPLARGNVYILRRSFQFQSVIQMSGFRSLGEGEDVEFISEETPKGPEAVKVKSPNGGQIKGSDRRPASKKKSKPLRLLIKNGPSSAFFSFIFVFSNRIFATIICEKYPSGIWCRDSIPQPSDCKSSHNHQTRAPTQNFR